MTPETEVYRRFEDRAARQLTKRQLPLIVGKATDSREIRRREIFAPFDLPGLRGAAEGVRAHTLANLDTYLDRFATRAEARGTKVFFAGTAAEAVGYIQKVVADHGASVVAKAKSMAAEEIHLNHHLEAAGIRVVETDLGEHIVQIAHEAPSHITAPAVHKTRAEVATLFSQVYGKPLPSDPEVLTNFARGILREQFLAADVGISGVNFAVADTGSFMLVTNEGNGRMVTSLPKVHIALMGMERIVPSFRELALMLPMLVGSALGRSVSTYFSFINGPRLDDDVDGPDEVHVIVLDNGRSKILGTEFQSVLHCIRCGACQNVCPVYRQVGGHAYGTVYGGPIGAVLTPLLVGFEKAGDLPHASSLCGACAEVCPVGIPLHEHLLGLRREVAKAERPPAEMLGFRAWSLAWRTSGRFRLFAWLSRFGQRLFARKGRISRAPFPLSRWVRSRDLPAVSGETFRERWDRRLKDGR